MTRSQCNHAPITTDDTLDAMQVTHDAFTSAFKQTIVPGATCEICGKSYYHQADVKATAKDMLAVHQMVRHGVAVVK